jgi:uncharacterized protein YjbJ (UPF0337 family)
MNCHQLIGNRKQVKGAVEEGWRKLTEDNVDVIAGKRDIPSGKIQEGHGIACEHAEKEFNDCEASLR